MALSAAVYATPPPSTASRFASLSPTEERAEARSRAQDARSARLGGFPAYGCSRAKGAAKGGFAAILKAEREPIPQGGRERGRKMRA